MTFTEMVSTEGIIRNQKKSLAMTEFRPDEQPLGVQLFGSNPEVMGQAAAIVSEHANPDLIDLNFGCPVRKVVNKNGGAAILKDLKLTEEIIRAVVNAVPGLPVTIKMRTGWDDNHPVYIEAGLAAQEAGAAAVTLHARSRAGGFSSAVDWSSIRQLKEVLDIPVIGNGDVDCPSAAGRMIEQTGCDGVMVGRAALGNPYIFSQINQFLETGEEGIEPTTKERVGMARRHIHLLVEEYGEERGCKMMRKHFGWYLRGFPDASETRRQLLTTKSIEEVEGVLSSRFDF